MTAGLSEILRRQTNKKINKLVFYPQDQLDLLSRAIVSRYTSVVVPRNLAQPIYNAINVAISESVGHESFLRI